MQKGELIKRFMASWKDRPYDNMLVCAAAALCGTFYYYDRQYEFSTDLCVIITILIYAVWIGCAFISGKERKVSFIIFSYSYWLIPFLYTLYYSSRDNLRNYSKWHEMINEIASALLKNPFRVASIRMGSDAVTLAALLLIAVMLAYVGGYFLAFFYEKHFLNVRENASEREKDFSYESDDSERSSNIIEYGSLNDMLFGAGEKKDGVENKSTIEKEYGQND